MSGGLFTDLYKPAYGPECCRCGQRVPGVPEGAAKDFKVYCSERCIPTPSVDWVSVRGRFDGMKLRNW